MSLLVLGVFCLVYLGMIFGGIPRLALDRTGIALLGALLFVVAEIISPAEAWASIDLSTILLLFSLMIVSAQFRLGGFYTWATRGLAEADVPPWKLLGGVIALSGALSALLANDIVCLAMAPILVEGCARRRVNPVPFLLALACASNVGSAATLIGNPQNMLIGQSLGLSFAWYLKFGVPVAVLGLAATFVIIVIIYRGQWSGAAAIPKIETAELNRWQTSKGMVVLSFVIASFLFSPWPREIVALGAVAWLLTSRRMASKEMIGLVDWQLLLLFMSLFIVNHVFREAGWLTQMLEAMRQCGIELGAPYALFAATAVLSNLVSNVPAVMLLLPVSSHQLAGPILALSSTLAGNFIIVGSIANIIVVEQADSLGVKISWEEHAKTGIPVTLATLAIAALVLAYMN